MPARLHLVAALAAALLAAPLAAAAQPGRFYAGFAAGVGLGAARVEGARLEFGRRRAAVAMSARAGLALEPALLLGLHLDAAGASSGRVVPLGPCIPGYLCPTTTAHRVAVNHWSLVGTWRPGAELLVRAGGGLSESFTEDWSAAARPVRRSFGPGLTGGLGWAPLAVADGVRLSVNADLLLGRPGGRASGSAAGTGGLGGLPDAARR
jgi:hypothetical protein